jgi:hypothetical protein
MLIPAPVYIPLSAGILSALSDQPYTPAPNFICPTSDCQVKNVNMLAVCSTCETESIDINSFEECKASVRALDGSETFFKDGSYADLRELLTDLSHYKGPYEIEMECDKLYTDYPTIHLRLDVAGSTATLQQPEGVYRNLQSTNTTLESYTGGIKSCVYTGIFPWSKTNFDKETSFLNSTCFTSTTDINAYNTTRETIGQINGTVTKCNLHFCAHHYDAISVVNGEKQHTNLTKQELVLQPDENTHTPSRTTWKTRASILPNGRVVHAVYYSIYDYSYSALAAQFLQIANVTKDINSQFSADSIIGNGSALSDFTRLFDTFADVMTAAIQSSAIPENANSTVPMAVYATDIFVEVRWVWMILPLALVLLGLVFFALTVLEGRKKGYLLKTSVLAVMFYGLEAREWGAGGDGEEEEEEVAKERARENGLAREAKRIRVAFVRGDDGGMKLKRE